MKLQPLFDRILVRREQAADKSKGGILIPDTAKEKTQRGEVLACGPGSILPDGGRGKMDLKCGDVVVFSHYSGNEVELDGDKVLILGQNDVLAVVR